MMLAMIPARMGSQRLSKKNLRPLAGAPLIAHAIRKCVQADCFDGVWVNSEHEDFRAIAEKEGAQFHLRPQSLANHVATSEDYIREFLELHACDYLVQVHSIAPLLMMAEIQGFAERLQEGACDTLLSCTLEQIECAYQGKPINFSFEAKTNSQDLLPVQRIPWSITGWRAAAYLEVARAGGTATYAGRVEFFPISRLAGHIIKTEEDLRIAEALWPLVNG